jgi:peptidoglycan hydrolase CwlO-like protein
MNDKAERLRAAIADLERELHGLESSDPETRELLKSAAADIATALQERPGAGSAPATDATASKNLLEQKVLEFEASHPQLSLALTRFIDMLGQIGI